MCLNLPASNWDLHRQQLAGCYFLTRIAAGAEVCRLKSMVLLWPLQQRHSCCGAVLRGVPLPDGRGYFAVCRQNSGKTTGNLGSAWGSLLYQKDICLVLSFYRFSHIWLAGGRNIPGGISKAVSMGLWRPSCMKQQGAAAAQSQLGPKIHTATSTTGLARSTAQGQSGQPGTTQGWSQCKQQVTWGRLGHRRKKERCRKLPEETGKQRKEVSGGTRGESVSIRVSHIKVKKSGWCEWMKWICLVRRKGKIGYKEECFVLWMAQSQFDTKILTTDFQNADEIALLQMSYH